MSSPAFEAFRRRVLSDPSLQADLLAHDDPATFAATVVERAARLGLTIEPDAVTDEIRSARRAWLERWI